MNVFEAVKQSVTTRQAAEHYGIHVGRNGMACCPFHHDKTPSMKLDRRYHCFGCGADGDVIDFAAALYGLGKKEAAVQLAQDFGLSYEDWKPPGKAKKPKPRQKSPEEQFQEAKNRCFRILADYLHLHRSRSSGNADPASCLGSYRYGTGSKPSHSCLHGFHNAPQPVLL